MKCYRKIYEHHSGLIPTDNDGRKYDIHHIDGNHKNDSPENLRAVTIQEHYDIHYAQGDWWACQAILMRMNKTPEEISRECSVMVKKRISAGLMPWLDSEYARERELKKVKGGTHSWQGEKGSKLATARNLRRVKEGTNPFAGEQGSKRSKETVDKQIKAGTHPFIGEQGSILGKKNNAKMLAAGTHPSQNKEINQKKREQQLEKSRVGTNNFQLQIKNGTHPSQKCWTCSYCGTSGKGASNFTRCHGDNCKMKGKK